MKVVVIGAGAMGKTVGGLLALSGNEVHFLVRSEYATWAKAPWFDIKCIELNTQVCVQGIHLHACEKTLPKCDLVILATKTTSNHAIKTMLTAFDAPSTDFLILQNGLGNEEFFAQTIHRGRLWAAIATTGATRLSPNCVRVNYLGRLKIAPYPSERAMPALLKLQKTLKLGHASFSMPVQIYPCHLDIRWHKLMWNIPFGLMSILFEKTTEHLLTDPVTSSIVDQLIGEITLIAQSQQVTVSKPYILQLLKRTRTIKDYWPSIYVDFKKGNPIEKEFMFDHPIEIAQKNNINTPCLQLARAWLAQLEASIENRVKMG